MKVNIPSPLRSYTSNAKTIEAVGTTVAEVLANIEGRFPGFRFRIIDEQDGVSPLGQEACHRAPGHTGADDDDLGLGG